MEKKCPRCKQTMENEDEDGEEKRLICIACGLEIAMESVQENLINP